MNLTHPDDEPDCGFSIATADFAAFVSAYNKVMQYAKSQVDHDCVHQNNLHGFLKRILSYFDEFPAFANLHRRHFFTVFRIIGDLDCPLNFRRHSVEFRINLQRECFDLRCNDMSITDDIRHHDRPRYCPPYPRWALSFE